MSNDDYKIERAARFTRVALLRDSGMKWKEVAKELGVSIARVQVMYMYNDNDMPDSVRDSIREKYGYKCIFCDKKHTKEKPLHVHHIKGKEHKISNLLLVCFTCHSFLHKLKRNDDEAYCFFINRYRVRV